jgi:TANFOR domain-containing protein
MKRLLSLTVILLCFTLSPMAQQVQVSVMIQPPYSNRVLDYFERGDNVVVRLTNLSNEVQQIKLMPTLEGNNGVSARIRENFVPSAPIILSPGASVMYNLNQLRTFNGNLKDSDVIMQGISRSVFDGAGLLPEGTYTLCVSAVQYNGNVVVSNPPGCTMFMISSYDPPMILAPLAGGEVDLVSPQLLSFQWTPSGISGKTRYTIRIVDMTSLNLLNADDAFNNPFVAPIFEQSNLSMSLFLYDMGKPQLFPDRNYAVQVIAYDPGGIMTYKNNGASLAHSFTLVQPQSGKGNPFGDLPPPAPEADEDDAEPLMVDGEFGDEDIIPPLDPDDVPGCMEAGACQIQEPTLEGTRQPQVGEVVNLGKFKLTITQIQGGSGSGTVQIPYMQTLVEVAFQNLNVNQVNQVCGASMVWVRRCFTKHHPRRLFKEPPGCI